MAANLDQAYLRWSREGLSDPGHPEELSIAQMLDHGSISFGRYAVESLSWEKRSVFTHNKRQEELEKCKAPGLVAKKKAYFEEYYKKIRNLKGLADADQQTEVTLDYRADSSISSQTGEDDETALQIQAPREKIDATCHGLCSVETAREQNKNNNALTIRLSNSDLSSRCSDEINLEKVSNHASQIMHWEFDVTTTSSEKTVRNLVADNLEKNSSDASQVIHTDHDETVAYIDSPEKDVEDISLKKNVQMEHETNGCSVHDVSNLIIHGADVETSFESKKGCISACEPCSSSQLIGTNLSLTEQNMLGNTPAHDDKSDKVKTSSKKNKELTSNSGTKESGASIGTYIKPGDRIKLDQSRTSHRTNYLHQKRMGNKEHIANSPNRTDTILPRNNKLCFPSCRPKEVHSNITIPRPFSFSKEKRAVTEKRPSTGLKGSGSGKFNSKTTVTSTSVGHGKDELPLQNISKTKTVGSSKKSTNLERNRQHESFCRKPLVMENNCNKIKERDGSTERPKPWSINLPPSDRPHLNSRSNSGGVRVRGKQEREVVNGVSETCGISKLATPPTARKSKAEVKQMVSSRTSDLVVNMKKPRQEVKRWR